MHSAETCMANHDSSTHLQSGSWMSLRVLMVAVFIPFSLSKIGLCSADELLQATKYAVVVDADAPNYGAVIELRDSEQTRDGVVVIDPQAGTEASGQQRRSTATHHFLLFGGAVLLSQGYLEDAIPLFENAHRLAPNDERVSAVLDNAKKLQASEVAFNRAAKKSRAPAEFHRLKDVIRAIEDGRSSDIEIAFADTPDRMDVDLRAAEVLAVAFAVSGKDGAAVKILKQHRGGAKGEILQLIEASGGGRASVTAGKSGGVSRFSNRPATLLLHARRLASDGQLSEASGVVDRAEKLSRKAARLSPYSTPIRVLELHAIESIRRSFGQ